MTPHFSPFLSCLCLGHKETEKSGSICNVQDRKQSKHAQTNGNWIRLWASLCIMQIQHTHKSNQFAIPHRLECIEATISHLILLGSNFSQEESVEFPSLPPTQYKFPSKATTPVELLLCESGGTVCHLPVWDWKLKWERHSQLHEFKREKIMRGNRTMHSPSRGSRRSTFSNETLASVPPTAHTQLSIAANLPYRLL